MDRKNESALHKFSEPGLNDKCFNDLTMMFYSELSALRMGGKRENYDR